MVNTSGNGGSGPNYMAANIRSWTSVAAYQAIESSGMLSRAKWEVYKKLYESGPMTRNELDTALAPVGKVNPTFSRRLVELERLGVAQRVGTRKCSKTGFDCDAWDVTDRIPATGKVPSRVTYKSVVQALLKLGPFTPTGGCRLCGVFAAHTPSCVWKMAEAAGG